MALQRTYSFFIARTTALENGAGIAIFAFIVHVKDRLKVEANMQ
jgi:hypothetical protein